MKNKKVGIITQARMGSSRLPGKVLKEIKGKALLAYHIERLKSAGYPIFIATSIEKVDDLIESFCLENGYSCFRGSEQDVLDRFYQCAKKNELDIIVRVTSDCPLIDGELIDLGVKTFLSEGRDDLYVSNCIERTYPRGFDFEIFSRVLLNKAAEEASENFEREHVTPFIRKHSENRNILRKEDRSSYRLTVDTSDDFSLMEELLDKHQADKLTHEEIIKVMNSHSHLKLINAHVEQKKA